MKSEGPEESRSYMKEAGLVRICSPLAPVTVLAKAIPANFVVEGCVHKAAQALYTLYTYCALTGD